jgi:hypothetical protein
MAFPRMFIAAGPPGGGKSSFFALSGFADRVFNADDRAAELNGGSFENIPTSERLRTANLRSSSSRSQPCEHPRLHLFRVGDDSEEHDYVRGSFKAGSLPARRLAIWIQEVRE